MSFFQSLVVRLLIQSLLMGFNIQYNRAKRIADAFSLLTAIITLDPNGHIAGVVLEELIEDAIFTSGEAVLPAINWNSFFSPMNSL